MLDEVLKYVEEDISRNVGMEIEETLDDETSRYVSIGDAQLKEPLCQEYTNIHLAQSKKN